MNNGRISGLPSISLLTNFIAKSKGPIDYNTHCNESCVQLGEAPFVLHLKNEAAGQEYLFFRAMHYLDVWEKHIKEYNEGQNV